MMLFNPHVEHLIELALDEDLSAGDATTDAIFPPEDQCKAVILAKSKLVLAGRDVFTHVMHRFDPSISISWYIQDGQEVEPRTPLGELSGSTRAVLKAERTALNFIQRMSGVATLSRRYAEQLEGTDTWVTDTRKTLPGWRVLDKYSVLQGGARNHRFNLGSGVMIKDNHIAAAGSIAEAVKRVRKTAPHTLRIEVEVEDLAGLKDAVQAGADVILLDNMSNDEVREAVQQARTLAGERPVLLEASGGITIERLPALAETGVDLISVGALTHSVKAADISLDVKTSL